MDIQSKVKSKMAKSKSKSSAAYVTDMLNKKFDGSDKKKTSGEESCACKAKGAGSAGACSCEQKKGGVKPQKWSSAAGFLAGTDFNNNVKGGSSSSSSSSGGGGNGGKYKITFGDVTLFASSIAELVGSISGLVSAGKVDANEVSSAQIVDTESGSQIDYMSRQDDQIRELKALLEQQKKEAEGNAGSWYTNPAIIAGIVLLAMMLIGGLIYFMSSNKNQPAQLSGV